MFVAITCPHCGEVFETAFDPTENDAEFVIDCEVCCRPMLIVAHVRNGVVDELRVTAS